MSIALLTNTAWHSQINKQSKRFNQTIEIAFRYFIINNFDILWWQALSILQTQLNNFSNVVIGFFFNEIIYDFKIKKTFFLFNVFDKFIIKNLIQRCLKYRAEVVEIIAFINVKVKIYYNARHILLMMRSNVDKAYLKFNHDYQLSRKFNKKISFQWCDSFFIKQRIERLAYELKLSFNWRVHSVISIIQLKFDFIENSYGRSRSDYSDAVKMKDDIFQWKSYEVKRIMNKCYRNYNEKNVAQYLFRWKKYESK